MELRLDGYRGGMICFTDYPCRGTRQKRRPGNVGSGVYAGGVVPGKTTAKTPFALRLHRGKLRFALQLRTAFRTTRAAPIPMAGERVTGPALHAGQSATRSRTLSICVFPQNLWPSYSGGLRHALSVFNCRLCGGQGSYSGSRLCPDLTRGAGSAEAQDKPEGLWKDPSWSPRAPLILIPLTACWTPRRTTAQPGGSHSPRFTNLLTFPICSPFRPTASTGWSATSAGRRA